MASIFCKRVRGRTKFTLSDSFEVRLLEMYNFAEIFLIVTVLDRNLPSEFQWFTGWKGIFRGLSESEFRKCFFLFQLHPISHKGDFCGMWDIRICPAAWEQHTRNYNTAQCEIIGKILIENLHYVISGNALL